MATKSFKVSFTLDGEDVAYFRRLFRRAKKASKQVDQEEILDVARDLVRKVRASRRTPKFVKEAISSLEDLTQIITDPDYQPPKSVRNDVLAALAYFANPHDLIPDHVPGLGFLDDALMIKFVEEEFKYELRAFRKFRKYRDGAEQRPWTKTAKDRLPGKLATQREKLRDEVNRKKRSNEEKQVVGF